MVNRETVIGQLETLATCGRYDALVVCVAWEAIALLKEQEPMEPDKILTNPVCGVCDEPLDVTDEYCRHCGRPIKWRC